MTEILAALINGALLSILPAAAVWLALRLTPRRTLNAATRYAIWWATLAAAAALPLLFLPRPAPPPRRYTPHPIPRAAIALPAPVAIFRPVPLPPPPATATPTFPVEVSASAWPRDLLLAWTAISALLLFRLLTSFLLLARLNARAVDLHRRLPGRRNARLAESAEIAIPVAVGPWHPAVLLPAGLSARLDPGEFEQIVLHETSHLERRDDCFILLQRALEAVFALHPVVRWIGRQLDLEREIACDDRVIAVTGRPRSYATCLTRIVELSAGTPARSLAAAAAGNRSHLARRIDSLLDKTRHTGTQLLKGRLGAMLALLLCLAWIAGRSPGFVAFARPIVHTLRQAPARLLSRPAALLPLAAAPQSETPEFDMRVIEDSTGNPLASAEVRFHKTGMRELAADLETDRYGRARASGLPPGDYSLEILKPNFVTASLKVRTPVTGLTVRLVRYGILSGQITDQSGQPVPAIIHAPYGQAIGGTRIAILVNDPDTGQLKVLREAQTEDAGRYRIFDLTPGVYAIGVWYDGLKDGSGVQIYPDNAHPRFFTISGGEEYDHIDFTITPQPVFQVGGKVEIPSAKDVFSLALALPDQPAMPIAQTLSADDGVFHFEKVPAGVYDLLVGGPQRGYGAHASVVDGKASWARMRVAVSQNIADLVVPLTPGRALNVTLAANGAAAPPEGCPKQATVMAMPVEAWPVLLTANRANVKFGEPGTLANLPPAHFRVSADGLPPGCYQRNAPVADMSADQPAPVAIELAPAGSIRGNLRGASDPASYSVLLLDTSAAGEAVTRLARPDAQGRFLFDSLHPGRYRIAAQPAAEAAKSRWVADVNKMLEIDIPAGSPTDLDLPVAKAGRQ